MPTAEKFQPTTTTADGQPIKSSILRLQQHHPYVNPNTPALADEIFINQSYVYGNVIIA